MLALVTPEPLIPTGAAPTVSLGYRVVMGAADGEALVRRYVQFISGSAGSGPGIEDILAEDFFDHVSGQRGAAIWAQVAQWARATFADPAVDVHEIMSRGDRVLVWMTVTATHVGSGFPRLRGIPVSVQAGGVAAGAYLSGRRRTAGRALGGP